MSMDADALHAVWHNELDALELDVIRAERLLKGLETLPTEPWNPPPVPGAMPADLVPRAQDLLDRQAAARAALRDALTGAQRQIAFHERVSGATGRGASGPVYLDVEA